MTIKRILRKAIVGKGFFNEEKKVNEKEQES